MSEIELLEKNSNEHNINLLYEKKGNTTKL